eukprot:TRINITY_DN9598_c0_g1_i1.p1 TRINITY_DN9598_c0_g1~~TRINITY_DN9598_c0_g1_i1.p1  ORF type:complete len:188 (+),score=29.29 TRINITY_DN9598_c0_g1_i1:57-566(+)
MSWPEFLAEYLKTDNVASLIHQVSGKHSEKVLHAFKWLGLFSNNMVVARVKTPLDALCSLLSSHQGMQFGQTERDMACLVHRFVVKNKDGSSERITSSLVIYGDEDEDGFTAMSKTVGIPIAVTVGMILDGAWSEPGVHVPLSPTFAITALNRLRKHGITFHDISEDLD